MLLKLGAFLLLGAIINVAVAWGLALRREPDDYGYAFSACRAVAFFNTLEQTTAVFKRTGDLELTQNIWSQVIGGGGFIWNMLDRDDYVRLIPLSSAFAKGDPVVECRSMLLPGDLCLTYTERSNGWPMLALRCTRIERTGNPLQGGRDATVQATGILLPQSWQSEVRRVLPLCPLWPGFAINTIFYAVTLWLLWIAPGKVRQFVRIRGHRCPACGFIIAPNTCANGLCSECGATLPKGLLDKSPCEV